MRRDAKRSGKANSPQRVTSRGLTVYDKIAAARERREGALADRQSPDPSPDKDDDAPAPETPVAPDDRAAPAPDAPTDDTGRGNADRSEPQRDAAPRRDRRAPGGVRLWLASTLIASVAILIVAWGSRPAGTGLLDVIPVSSTRPAGPSVTTNIQGLPASPGIAPQPVAPGKATVPQRVEFGPMPGAQVADVAPGTTPPPELLAPDSAPLRELRVVVNAPQTVTDGRLESVVDALRSGGVSPSPRRVNLTITRSNVRFFHPEDRDTAALIAIAISADLRDFTDFEPKPEDALVEIWLSGREIGAGRQGADPLDQLSEELRRLERSLRQALSGN